MRKVRSEEERDGFKEGWERRDKRKYRRQSMCPLICTSILTISDVEITIQGNPASGRDRVISHGG